MDLPQYSQMVGMVGLLNVMQYLYTRMGYDVKDERNAPGIQEYDVATFYFKWVYYVEFNTQDNGSHAAYGA